MSLSRKKRTRYWSRDRNKCYADWVIQVYCSETGRKESFFIQTKALDDMPEHRIPCFETIFLERMQKNGPNKSLLAISDATAASNFGVMLDFLYCKTDQQEEDLLSNVKKGVALYQLANYFQIRHLQDKLSSFYRNMSHVLQDGVASIDEQPSRHALVPSNLRHRERREPKSVTIREDRNVHDDPIDQFARSMHMMEYIERDHLHPDFFVKALARRKALGLPNNRHISENISCLIAICAEGNSELLTRSLFYKLTHEDYIPYIDQEAALQLLTIEGDRAFWRDNDSFSSLQGRCVKSLLSDWKGLRRKFHSDEDYWKGMRKLSPSILGVLLMHSTGAVQGGASELSSRAPLDASEQWNARDR